MIVSRMARRNSRLVSEERKVFARSRRQHFMMGALGDKKKANPDAISVSVDMPMMGVDMRPIHAENNRVRSRASRMAPRRRQELSAVKCFDWPGMRASAAVWLVVLLCATLGVITLFHEAKVASAGINATNMERRLQEEQNKVADLQVDYSKATADVDQAKLAASLGFVSSKGVKAIKLYAPEIAVYSPAEIPPRLPRDSLATILGE